ncbi:T9SS type A sorting domain-containing protein [candidate division KSB1 bacterium]|nr:T9SS type A sorting domain-containing protein [candidate division KSB1 bacterium]
MTKIIVYSLFLFLLLLKASISNVVIPPTNENIRYTGRWNFDNPSTPWVAWQGSSIIVKFNGTGISVDISGTAVEQYRVIIDSKPEENRRVFSSSRNTYALAKNLADGLHTVELFKETFNGKTHFYGLEVTGDGLLPLHPRPSLRIEFFGDSNMNGSSSYSEKNNGDMGTYYAFPAIVTRMLGAEMHNQSVGGANLYDSGDNCVGSFIFSQDYYNQNPDYRSGFDPHIIVVNAGANDVGSGKSVIKRRYKNVVADLRTVYGSAPQIILMNAYGWDVNEPANYSHEVVNELDDPNLSVCLFPWLWEQWHGCQWDHSGEAYVLLDHITSLNPDWKQVNPGDIVDGFGRNWDVANGSFERAAPFGGFGWRYRKDGVERVYDPSKAADGDYYIRLEAGEKVHQPTDATGDFLPGATNGGETYFVTAKIRGATAGAKAQILFDFQGQQIWTRGKEYPTTIDLSTEWQTYRASIVAPAGKWTLFTTLKSLTGTVEFDDVRMSNTDTRVERKTETSFLYNNAGGLKVYPNPFNMSTTIEYKVAHSSTVNLDIYNIRGEKVAELVNQKKDAGTFSVNWDTRHLASGLFMMLLKTNSIILSQKVIVLK